MDPPDNVKVSDARLQSYKLKFNFITELDKLIINATCSKDNIKYVGEIAANPHIDFQLIKQMVQEGEYKTMILTQNLLKIRIGATIVELIPKQKSQIKELKETLQKSLKRQQQLENIIKSQQNEFNEYKNMVIDLKKTVQQMKQSPKTFQKLIDKLKQQLKQQIDEINVSIENQYCVISDHGRENQHKIQEFKEKLQQLSNSLMNLGLQFQVTNVKIQYLYQAQETKVDVEKLQDEVKLFKKEFQQMKEMVKKVTDQNKLLSAQMIEYKLKMQYYEAINNREIKVNQDNKINKSQNYQIIGREQIQRTEPKQPQMKKIESPIIYPKNRANYTIPNRNKQYSWSRNLKGNNLQICDKIVRTTPNTEKQILEFCLLQANFKRQMRRKQSWQIKINTQSRYLLRLGICLKNVIRQKNFNGKEVKWGQNNDGVYVIDSGGWVNSHSWKEYRNTKNSFCFNKGDIILVEYDPVWLKLRFSKNNNIESFEFPILPPPMNDAYHPCVCFYQNNKDIQPNQIQLVRTNIEDDCLLL